MDSEYSVCIVFRRHPTNQLSHQQSRLLLKSKPAPSLCGETMLQLLDHSFLMDGRRVVWRVLLLEDLPRPNQLNTKATLKNSAAISFCNVTPWEEKYSKNNAHYHQQRVAKRCVCVTYWWWWYPVCKNIIHCLTLGMGFLHVGFTCHCITHKTKIQNNFWVICWQFFTTIFLRSFFVCVLFKYFVLLSEFTAFVRLELSIHEGSIFNVRIHFLGKSLSIIKHYSFYRSLQWTVCYFVDWCPLDVPHSSVLSPCDDKTPGWQLYWDISKDNEYFPPGV